MGLAEDIRRVADVALAALNDTHDYFTFTKRAWRLMHTVVNEGRKFTLVNSQTKTRMDQRAIVARSRVYV
jgi:hypothetical protein